MPSPVVLILGAPSTGNHAWLRIATHNGASGLSGVYHFGRVNEARAPAGHDIRALIPVRDRACAIASMQARHPGALRAYGLASWDEAYDRSYAGTVEWLAQRSIPALPISYERLIDEQEDYARAAVDWLGLTWRGLPEPIRDENRKHLAFTAHEIT